MNRCMYEDCKHGEYKGLVCQLCYEGYNFSPTVNSGILRIDLHQYKYLLRGKEWIRVFDSRRLQDAVSHITMSRWLSKDLVADKPMYRTVVYTQCMAHQNQVHKDNNFIEELDNYDGYYAMEYRNVLYLLHKSRKLVYVKAILNWEGKINAV